MKRNLMCVAVIAATLCGSIASADMGLDALFKQEQSTLQAAPKERMLRFLGGILLWTLVDEM